ncbi:uncharacterized protein LOC118409672 [Branchiostoma floridae]|uniref:Uncharacterized protein LOC118409672 n=1 Tax=Branchiostoma floridae TaxID=7739 RepID=A0A9J7KMT9_BRAFL|nr:uncharacterized protein LOC118409672 [Branchiostoma floridae]
MPGITWYQWIRPSDIHFTADMIPCKFSNGSDMLETFRQLLFNEVKITDIPKIEVIYKDGSWWAYFGNRRLWILREVERLGRCAAVECIVLPKDFCSDEKWLKKLKNRDEGQSVGVEKTERFDVEYQTIIEAWRKKTIYGMDAPTQLEVMMGKEAGTPKTARGGKVFTFPNGTSGSSQTKSATKNMGQFFKDLVLCSVIVSTSAIGALTMVSYFLGNSLIATTMKSILADLDFPFDWAEEE